MIELSGRSGKVARNQGTAMKHLKANVLRAVGLLSAAVVALPATADAIDQSVLLGGGAFTTKLQLR